MSDFLSPADIVESGLCIGCGSCAAQSGAQAQMAWDAYGQLKPKGTRLWYNTPSETFSCTCPFSPKSLNEDEISSWRFSSLEHRTERLGNFQSAYVGHVGEEDFRLQGSSGGMVTWVANELLRAGLVDGVAHVVASENPREEGRFFSYRISTTEADVRCGAKSRYYPIELSGVLQTIMNTPGRYAVVGIPCFIKAVHLLRKNDPVLEERIVFTLGLFCGHMKSARFVESFAWQMKVPAQDVQKVEFRHKDPNRPANWYNAMLTLNNGRVINKDWWHLADGDWGAGFFMNSACNFCDDVVAETADVAFGDAWVEPYSSDGKGTNVVVARSAIINQLIKDAIASGRLELSTVDDEFVEQTQAAGFRQRREGLAYRLIWAPTGVQPLKRVAPHYKNIHKSRKLIYRIRFHISKWSHRMFLLARKLKWPGLYTGWARLVGAAYYGFAYHKGKFREMVKRFQVQ
ncbi:MAG TPA: Coenzyme F420 hydrogenase/dehydrogenase, beta subunit C-terminal domain [Chitinophagaceae bacterium]|nr:Coenzyme F420 hydrogenase/dehydrogenase, beta subunit C-terminal domain [Chitinophagaceae bacterium]